MIERIAYGGWANNVKLSNGQIEVVATLDVGPRVIRCGFTGGPNVFKEFPEQMGGTGESEWMIRGGHRLWLAPEEKPRSYSPDNGPVELQELGPMSIRLIPAPEKENGIQKQLDILMSEDGNEVMLTHRLINLGAWDIMVAPWAPTVMDAGGVAIVPLPEKRPHAEVVTPDFPLIMWPYTDMTDSRYHWGRRYITFTQDAAKGPGKFGMLLKEGWAAYLVHGTLFVKYFDLLPFEEYPDFGCNFQTFSNEEMLEVESLGPLDILEAGASVEHVETWRLFRDVPAISDEESIDRIIRPLV